jgi:hypothetical protein
MKLVILSRGVYLSWDNGANLAVKKSDDLFGPLCLWFLTSPFLARMYHFYAPIPPSFIYWPPEKLLKFSLLVGEF